MADLSLLLYRALCLQTIVHELQDAHGHTVKSSTHRIDGCVALQGLLFFVRFVTSHRYPWAQEAPFPGQNSSKLQSFECRWSNHSFNMRKCSIRFRPACLVHIYCTLRAGISVEEQMLSAAVMIDYQVSTMTSSSALMSIIYCTVPPLAV
ncbi:hypothetical protein BKA93DRAFT_866570 [Sparassis latifolia]